MDLVVLAAGMGSRFGGNKQTEGVDEFDNFIIDYSIYDAIKCGFDRVVFLIRRENLEEFEKSVGSRIRKFVKVDYAFQENNNLPSSVTLPKERTKPLGTGHALLCLKGKTSEKFAIINADDFYGRESFEILSRFMKGSFEKDVFAMAGYSAKNTLSENGAVKRGVCEGGLYLEKITESKVERRGDKIFAKAIGGQEEREIGENCVVSMSMFYLTDLVFEGLEAEFEAFLKCKDTDLLTGEFLMPDVIENLVREKKVKVRILSTPSVWHGMTYREDKAEVIGALKELREKGEYPKNLWGN